MRHILFLCMVIALPYVANTKPIMQQNALAVYEGKYQMTVRGQTGYIQLATKNNELTLTALWTGEQNTLKHLSGDNFIMNLKDWSVRFIRDKKGSITAVLVMGHDLWTKVK